MTSVLWRGGWTARVRIVSGLILMLYVTLHFLNIAAVLVSVPFADAFQAARLAVTRSTGGEIVLFAALLAHLVLALKKLLQRRSLRMPMVDWVQIGAGLAIPILLSSHIIYTHIAFETLNVDTRLGYLTALIWDTGDGWWQALLLLLVWGHGVIGLHMWLRMTRWWRRWQSMLVSVAVLIPALALVGFAVSGRAMDRVMADPEARAQAFALWGWPDRTGFAQLAGIDTVTDQVIWALMAALALVLVIRLGVAAVRRPIRITYIDGTTVRAPRGQTILDTSLASGVDHTALCGGRGRCTTCRVIVEDGADNLPPPSSAEAKTLAAVGAPPNARLACQVRPTGPVTVFRVFRKDGKRGRAHASQGKEAKLAILFLDMRGFTARTNGQLPYDVVFLLNRFFDEIVPPIQAAGGTVDKYLGDGLLAVFEQTSPAASARAALAAVEGVGTALNRFNDRLADEGSPPVAIGMGVHLGNVVLGEIGAAGAAPRTLIGDAVNTASRLEGQTKTLRVQALLSIDVLHAAEFTVPQDDLQDLSLRGRDGVLPALPVPDAARLSERLRVLDSTSQAE
ncbi:MAG: adenylate/guanylate cyclase domain-containing protein [Pseudomonadota bacterium]